MGENKVLTIKLNDNKNIKINRNLIEIGLERIIEDLLKADSEFWRGRHLSEALGYLRALEYSGVITETERDRCRNEIIDFTYKMNAYKIN